MKHRLIMYAFLVVSLALSTTASAVTVTHKLEASVFSGDFAGTVGTGTLSYDDTLLDMYGDGYFFPTDPLTFDLSFTVFGHTFTTTNDADFPEYPEFEIISYELDFLSFYVDQVAQANIDAFGFGFDGFGENFTLGNDGVYRGELYVDGYVSAVPVPAAAWLFGTALLGLIGFGRRKINQA